MKILAIFPNHNSCVGIFQDGKCLDIYHEEKFSNKKHHLGWPHRTLDYLSKQYNFSEFDYVTITSEQQFYYPDDRLIQDSINELNSPLGVLITKLKDFYYYLWYLIGNFPIFSKIFNLYLHSVSTPKAKSQMEQVLLKEHNIPADKIIYVDHHLMHCLTPYYFYGINKLDQDTLFITMDGLGDDYFTRIYHYHVQDRSFELITQSPFSASLGLLYTELTRYLGMKPNEHEYKVMGLAAYVSNIKYYEKLYKKLSEYFWLDENELVFKSKVNTFVSVYHFLKHNFTGERFDNLSAAVQQLLEDLVTKYVFLAIKKTGVSQIALSGGVFMNVKLNKKIAEIPEVTRAYFQPSCGDESSVIGCAAKVFIDHNVDLKPINTMFLGNYYSNEQVAEFISKEKVADKYKVEPLLDDQILFSRIVELLAQFEIVALHRGRCEWGARSLCNRTILGNASDLKTFYQVNDMIKMRDFWMPFAPTILAEWASRYIKNWDILKSKVYESSKYMILGFDSTQLAQEHLRAAIHQKDKSLRPQILDETSNKDIYKLFKLYEQKTGMGGMLNTSLNIHGYPLAGTLEQSLFTFENSGLEYLALENYLISKK